MGPGETVVMGVRRAGKGRKNRRLKGRESRRGEVGAGETICDRKKNYFLGR